MDRIKQTINRYRHAWVLLYMFIYMPWFLWLERRVGVKHFIIHSPIDDYIPFVEYFIVPYLLWFIFIIGTAAYFFFKDTAGFYRYAAFLCAGMTLFLIICTVFPNALNLRPHTFVRDNIFSQMVQMLYAVDTPTNVLPSIHVFNSVGAVIAISRSQALRASHRKIQYASYALAILIILSTVFLKQHSVTDVMAAFALAGLIYPFVYATEPKKAESLSRQMI